MTKLSVLIPSRGRPEFALNAINSFPKLHNIEFLIAIDEDEKYKDTYLKMNGDRRKIIVCPRYRYINLHEYYNTLAAASKGDWLMLFNDDAVLKSPELYDFILQYDHTKPVVLNIWHPIDNLFPIVSRKFYEILGHYSLSAHADSWVQQVSQETNTQIYVPGVTIEHFRERMDDDTFKEGRDDIRVTAANYNSREMMELREKDMQKIRSYLDETNN